MDTGRNGSTEGIGTVKPLREQIMDLQLEVLRLIHEVNEALYEEDHARAAQLLGQMIATNERAIELNKRRIGAGMQW